MQIEHQALIENLNKLGYNVVLINDELFIFTEFIPAQDLVNKHRLVGKSVEGLLQNYGHILNTLNKQVTNQLIQHIDSISPVSREYSVYFEWITFLSR